MACLLRDQEIEVVATTSAVDLVRKVIALRSDVAVLDADRPDGCHDESAIGAVRALRARATATAVLLLSHDLQVPLRLFDEHPVGVGYMIKGRVRDAGQLSAAARCVARGETVVDPEVLSILAGATSRDDPVGELTDRERQVMALMAEGWSNTSIAADLVVTVAAVERHVTSIFGKFGLVADGQRHRRVLAVLRFVDSGRPARKLITSSEGDTTSG
jgi:DNA-binding NarL/FixJ family response regulator